MQNITTRLARINSKTYTVQVNSSPIERVCLIDDDEDDCMVFKLALQEINQSIELRYSTSCENIAAFLSTTKPDLLFLDINLPKINGIECLQQIKKSIAESKIPVIMYSSSELPRDLLQAYESGAILYFRKPSNVSTLIKSLTYILNMAWHSPETIKSQHFKDGKYIAFQEATSGELQL
jgi:CheY-like chemotaxis protein